MKKIISILLVLMMVTLGCGGTTASAKAKAVNFSKKYINVTVGKTYNMKSLLRNNKKYTITWKSSNTKIATVSKSGVVKAKKKGSCVISAYIKQTKKTIKCKVYVKNKANYRTLRVKTVAYCPCRSCSGGYGTNTASGRKAKAGRTIAVDRRIIPLGSKVVIDGHTYIAEDTGVRGYMIDIYMSSHSQTERYGARYKTVKVYYK